MDLTRWQADLEIEVPHSQIEFARGGVTERLDERDVGGVPFESVDRVRVPPSWKHKSNYTGFYWAATTGGHVWFESLYEKAALMRLDRNPDVVAIAAQPMWIHWVGDTHRHAPDFFVRFRDGSAALVDVKPAENIEPDDVVAFDRTRALCDGLGWEYFVVDDIGDEEVRNLRFLSGYRYERWREPRCIAVLREHGGESARLDAWAERLQGSFPEPLGAVYSALWWRDLIFDSSRHLSLSTTAKAA